MKKQVSFAARVQTYFLLFALFPLGVVCVLGFFGMDDLERQTLDKFHSAAENIADKIDRNIFERYGDVQAFAVNNVVQERSLWHKPELKDSALVHAMNEYILKYGLYYLTILVDLEGKVIAVNTIDSTNKPIDTSGLYSQNYAQSDWFKACMKKEFTKTMPFAAQSNNIADGTFIEDVHLDADVGKVYGQPFPMTLGFSAPVYDREGKIIAVWSNRAKFSLVEDIIKDAYASAEHSGYSTVEITLLDSTGRVLVDYDPTLRGGKEIQRDPNVLMKLNLVEKMWKRLQEPSKVKQEKCSRCMPARGINRRPGMRTMWEPWVFPA